MCVANCCKMSPASPFAYYPSRLVPPGAHLSFVELPLVPEVRNQHMSTLLWVSDCCKSSPACRPTYYCSRVVPPGARLSVMELPLVPVVQNHMCRLCRLFYVCRQLLQNVSSIPFCLLPKQTCAPWGSFVFYGAPFGS